MRLGEIGAGPLFEAPGPRGKRIIRRVRGVAAELIGFVVVTALLPLLAGRRAGRRRLHEAEDRQADDQHPAGVLPLVVPAQRDLDPARAARRLALHRRPVRPRLDAPPARDLLAAAGLADGPVLGLQAALRAQVRDRGGRGRLAGPGAGDDPPRLDHRQRAARPAARPAAGHGPALRDQARARDDPADRHRRPLGDDQLPAARLRRRRGARSPSCASSPTRLAPPRAS